MSRIRYIKPEAFTDEDLGALPPVVRWFYTGLWTQADCEGILEDKPQELKFKLIPYDKETGEQCLGVLASHIKVVRYQFGAKRYIWIPTLKEHQKFHKDEKPRGLPPPPPEVIDAYNRRKLDTLPAPCQHHVSTVPAPSQHPASSTETETETETGNWEGDGELKPAPQPKAAAAVTTNFVVPKANMPTPLDFEPDEAGEFKPTAWGFWGWHNSERLRRGLYDESTPPFGFQEWHDAAVAKVGIDGLVRAYMGYLESDDFRHKKWPINVFRSPNVWESRASPEPAKAVRM